MTRRADGQSRRRAVELTTGGRADQPGQRRCRVMEEAMLSGFNPKNGGSLPITCPGLRNLRAEREEGTE
ncbi:MAG: hypothetical protein ACLRWL_05580 [Evtepia gabavorous]